MNAPPTPDELKKMAESIDSRIGKLKGWPDHSGFKTVVGYDPVDGYTCYTVPNGTPDQGTHPDFSPPPA